MPTGATSGIAAAMLVYAIVTQRRVASGQAEVLPATPAAAPPQQVAGSDLTYYYRTDQELLDASRSAHAYCADNGWQQAVPSVRTNTDGSRTVLFQCA